MTKKPSKKEIKEVLARAKKVVKSEERIFDHPTDSPTLEKGKNIPEEKKKGAPAASPDKVDILLEKVEGIATRQVRLEEIYNKGVVTAKGVPGSQKKVTGHDQGAKTSEEILAEAEAEQEKAAGQGQPGQTQPQQQGQGQPFYETPEYKKLSDKEKRLAWEEGARQQQAQQQPQGAVKVSNQQLLYGAIEVAKIFAPVAQTAIAKGGDGDNPLKSFLEQMKVYQNIESTVLGGFFNFMKNLSPQQRQTTMDNIATSAPTPTVGDLSSKPEIIK